MPSFAKAQLLKYGWTEGKGLGKNENGIVDALKPKLKFDTSGVGHDSKEYKWWENVYNKAASNVEVDTTGAAEISVKIKDEDAVNISSSKLDLKKLKKTHNLQYGSFLKACTLDNGKMVPEESAAKAALDDIVHETPSFEMSDEQLFLACGGRTAHKGARHGLKLSGKLARIAQQEAELLGLPQRSLSESTDWQEVAKKKKKSKRKRRRSAAEMDLDSLISDCSLQTDANANTVAPEVSGAREQSPELLLRKSSKKTRRKDKRRVQDLVHQLGSVALVEDSGVNVTKKRKSSDKREIGETAADSAGEYGEKSSKRTERKGRDDREETNENTTRVGLPVETSAVITLADGATREKRKKNALHFSFAQQQEADRLNHRISKKKTKHHAKMQRKRVDRLSECLMAVNLCEDSVDSGRGEDLVESCEAMTKLKKWKKHRKERKDKRSEDTIITLDP